MKNIVFSTAALGMMLVLSGARAEVGPVWQKASVYKHSQRSADLHEVSGDVSLNDVIQDTCVRCHNERRLSGNLSLVGFDADEADQNAEIAERMIRKLRAGMMPPVGARRPGGDTLQTVVEELERVVDAAASRNPNPGGRTFQRLNRAEYEQAIRDLLLLKVDASEWLQNDQMSANFDNIADVQSLSATLLESYLNAASEISRWALGNRSAPAVDQVYKLPEYVSQHPWDHVEGAPYGTRGGVVIDHVFPADAEYVFAMTFNGGRNARLEDVDISIDGERVALLHYTRSGAGADGRGGSGIRTEPIMLRAGQHKVSAAFIRRGDGPYEDLLRPHEWSLAGGGSGGNGITSLPHLRDLIVSGPYNTTGISETTARAKIFSCRPTVPSEELACAREIVSRLGSEAYRRPLSGNDISGLMNFYSAGSARGGFEGGVRRALEAILASPHFVFRFEREPENKDPGEIYRLSDVDLASRLSFFLWGMPPDAELLEIAVGGKLSDKELARQSQRMLADPRSEALGTRFAGLWLRLQDLYKVRPDPNFYPNFDENLADAMRRETELFFYNLVREDKSFLELFSADYTFVNERLARHYGIPGVSGNHFRQVDYLEDQRRGLLGQGSVLVLTSMANRTSPVLRGKWVMEVLLGTPPPPPPPGVPDLDETGTVSDGKFLTTRERMELHRENPACSSCHSLMDPIGLALDNYDVTGRWRLRENGNPIDTRGDFYDGTPVSDPVELIDALLKRPIPLVRNFTENLMAFALGRRVEHYDQPTVREISKNAEKDGYRLSSFIMGIIQSDAFQMKRAALASTAEGGEQVNSSN
ncbi:MAG TPA: hypothetical protein DHW20_01180 [Gemmatimonadetes bacterium]|jgi:hypothetical protein|nr:hypothetical protein [Gemmatimonadota bacterium]|tara:strand:- start:9478 stop:11928 length:2451 start_codon:yes stop_codon:yes gene_type:complete